LAGAVSRGGVPFAPLARLRRGVALLLAPASAAPAQAPAAAPATACAKAWLGHEAEYEELLRTADVTRIEKLKIGVTSPRCAFVAAGLLFERMAWKTLKPGMYRGFYESYRSEIAAYELDKLIGLGMIPPSVERRIKGEVGAAILWSRTCGAGTSVQTSADTTRGPGPASSCGPRCSTS